MSMTVASTTASGYASGWRAWARYCDEYGIANQLQPEEHHLIGFVSWCTMGGRRRMKSTQPLAFATIKAYLQSIKYVHKRALLPDPITGAKALEMAVRGAKRLLASAKGAPKRKPKIPVTIALLEGLRSHFDLDVHEERVRWAILVCGVFGLMRLGELLGSNALRWSHVSWISADHIQLTLPASKTDPYRLGVAINFFGTDSVACPVAALTDLFERWPKQLPRDGSMFAMMNGKSLERKEFSSMLQARIDKLEEKWRVGLSGQRFSGHSLRRGGATSLALRGVSDAMIQVLGRWQSDAYKRYIMQPMATIRDAMRKMARCLDSDKDRELGVLTQTTSPFEPCWPVDD